MSSNPNRNKVLLGFSAIVAVLIVAILLWPANFRKEDASGAIGAVQKHRAPQITQQDVILGGESVKHEQQVLYKDFLADAGKLRSLSANRDVAAARAYEAELQMRAMRAARDAAEAASRINESKVQANVAELNKMIANKTQLSNEELQAFNRQLGIIAILIGSRESSFARMDASREELAHLSLANQELAAKQLADVEQAFNRTTANFELADEAQYLGMMEMESRAVANEDLAQRSANFELAAKQLESRAQANIAEAADREEQMAMRCQRMLADVQAAESRGTANARMVGSEQLSARLGALAQRLNQREAAAREIANVRQLDARQSQ
jgi:hypothetical protein